MIQLQGGQPHGLLLPIHWGTDNLALHHWAQPGEWSKEAEQAVALPRPGEPFEPTAKLPTHPWWQAVSGPIARPWRRPKKPTAVPAVQEELDLAGELRES